MTQNYINHIALVLDASASMHGHKNQLIKIADDQISYLAQRSKELDQETRVTVYTFNSTVECVVYDKDVLRLPSIRQFYRPSGMTALVDATLKSQDDLAMTPEIYGDHSFLTFVLTDGQENKSKNSSNKLMTRLASLPDHWTVAVLVPDQLSKHEAKRFGFPADNIAIWDTTTSRGLAEAGDKIRQATDTFMTNRASGVRGSRSLFSTGLDAVNKTTVKTALRELPKTKYTVLPVTQNEEIRTWVERNGHPYRVGHAYYQLTKTETIQPTKSVVVQEKSTGKVYSGADARAIIGLPDATTRVKPDHNPEFDVFIQSTSFNRKLVPGTKLVLIK